MFIEIFLAQEIKKEYGEKQFRNFSKEDQENIIAQKVMEKMNKGELITNPNDKRKFDGVTEHWYGKPKPKEIKKSSGIQTGGAAPIGNNKNSSNQKLSPFLQGFLDDERQDNRTSSQKLAEDIDNDKWNDNEIAFLEGFNSDEPDVHLIKEVKERRKEKAKSQGNKDKGSNGENGYWFTDKYGKHHFVPGD